LLCPSANKIVIYNIKHTGKRTRTLVNSNIRFHADLKAIDHLASLWHYVTDMRGNATARLMYSWHYWHCCTFNYIQHVPPVAHETMYQLHSSVQFTYYDKRHDHNIFTRSHGYILNSYS